MKKFKGILTIAAVAIGTLALTGCGKTTIDLNDYVTITSEGYDTIGEVWAHFDDDALRADYSKKISPSKEGAELAKTFGEDAIDLLLSECIDYDLNGNDEACNGDTYELAWDCHDAQAEEYFNVVLKYSDITYTVDNLKELGTFDPFENINVSFSGTSPMAEASYEVDSSKEEMSYVTVEWLVNDEPIYGTNIINNLKNGDTVTLHAYIPDYEIQDFASKYGCAIETDTKTYTCEVGDYYIDDVAQITEECLNEMIAKGEEAYRNEEAKETDPWDPKGIEEISYAGNYFLTLNDMSKYDFYLNHLYVIYNVKELDSSLNPVEFYIYVRFDNISKNSDGSCYVDLDKYDAMFERSIVSGFEAESGSYLGIKTYFKGTQDLTTFPDYIKKDIAFYNEIEDFTLTSTFE